MEITCYRDIEANREHHLLPASTYNLALTLLTRSPTGTLFVPIRSIQYLAILDAEEWVFLDGGRKCWVDIAWQHFHPQSRTSLEEPVPYDAAYYKTDLTHLMSRLQGELPRALLEVSKKSTLDGPARIIKFPALDGK
jgi:hypothetical protein